MQLSTANSESWSTRELRLGCGKSIRESNALERPSEAWRYGYTQVAQSRNSSRHQSFAARFVNGRNCTIHYRDSESLSAQGDGGGQPRRSSASNTNVSAHIASVHSQVRDRAED